jgi:hypothetical protein
MLSKSIKSSTIAIVIVFQAMIVPFSFITALTNSSRNTFINTQCHNDTILLETYAETLGIEIPFLMCSVPRGETSCTVDGKPFSMEFEKGCNDKINGIFHYESFQLKCTTTSSNDLYTLTYYNFPICFAATCTDEQMKNDFQTALYPVYESALVPDGFICDTQEISPTSNNSTSSTKSISGTNILTFTGTFLLLLFAQYVVL